jgi:hypothetical protein
VRPHGAQQQRRCGCPRFLAGRAPGLAWPRGAARLPARGPRLRPFGWERVRAEMKGRQRPSARQHLELPAPTLCGHVTSDLIRQSPDGSPDPAGLACGGAAPAFDPYGCSAWGGGRIFPWRAKGLGLSLLRRASDERGISRHMRGPTEGWARWGREGREGPAASACVRSGPSAGVVRWQRGHWPGTRRARGRGAWRGATSHAPRGAGTCAPLIPAVAQFCSANSAGRGTRTGGQTQPARQQRLGSCRGLDPHHHEAAAADRPAARG